MPPRKVIPGAPRVDPWKPTEWDLPDAAAIQALSRGDAGPDQQQRALRFIIEKLAGTYDMQFRPGGNDGDRATCFASGKAFVGQQLVKLLKLNLGKIRAPNEETEQG